MVTFIKYPTKEPAFCIMDRMEDKGDFIVVYPEPNKMGFYCKSLLKKDILRFKGGFNIERCTKSERVKIAREWYFSTKQKLPRKIKKNLINY